MNKVVAVVVTYNRLEMLKKCIVALQKQKHSCDILIIDNASTDNTEKYAKELEVTYCNIYYRNTGGNLGGAGGFNLGVRLAVEAGYEYIWVMDDDCLPKKNALDELINADRILNGQYGWLSSVVLWSDGNECLMNKQKYISSKNIFSKYGLQQAMQATFVSLMLKSKTIVKYGLPIKDFFIWGDDIEYTRRIAVRNKDDCYVVGNSKVLHVMQENTGSNIAYDNISRLGRYRYAYRNEYYLYKKEGVKGICYYFSKCIFNLLRIIFCANTFKYDRIVILVEGIFMGLTFNPKIEFLEERGIGGK